MDMIIITAIVGAAAIVVIVLIWMANRFARTRAHWIVFRRNVYPYIGLRGKTFWDWLQLFGTLGGLGTIAIAIFIFNAQRADERELETDRAHEAALRAYLDQIPSLLLDDSLRKPSREADLQAVVRAHTLTVLRDPDGERKRTVISFLHETGVILIDSPLDVVDLTANPPRRSILQDANLVDVDLHDLGLRRTNLHGANLSNANLSGSDLTEADLSNNNLANADLTSANLDSVILCGAFLVNANLTNTNLRGALLLNTVLRGADLSNANLSDANLSNANLPENEGVCGGLAVVAHLKSTDLSDANLSGANLNGAFLIDAVLIRANLSEANLSDANLSGANLSNVRNLTIGQLCAAWTLYGVTGLTPALVEQVKQQCPRLLEEPKDGG